MKATKTKKNLVVVLLVAILTTAAILPHLRFTAAAQPGEVTDPLVTRRYVDERIDDVWNEIQALRTENALLRAMVEGGGLQGMPFDVQALTALVTADVLATIHGGGAPGAGLPDGERSLEFVTLNPSYGQILTIENGTEVILRTGTAVVVAGPNGLVDMTQGRDIANGVAVSRNHLLIAPRTDGRGLRFTSESNWVMVRGAFTLN